MPVYTYRCKNCGVQFDQQQKFSDPPLTRCPECSKKTLQKVFQPVGIVFKGSGFYSTDHRSPSGGRASSNGSKEHREGGKESGEKTGDGEKSSPPKSETSSSSSSDSSKD